MNATITQADKIASKILSQFEGNVDEEAFDIKDAVIIGLLEEMVGKSKSIKILVDNSHYDAIDSIARSILESYVYLKFILSGDTDIRARAYYYSGKRSENKYYDQLISKDKKGRRIRKYLNLNLEEFKKGLEKESYEEYKERINNFYIDVVGEGNLKRKWFDLDGKTSSFENLCNNTGLEAEYEVIYRLLSKDVHSSRAYSRLKMEEGRVSVLFANADATMHKSLLISFLVNSVGMILNHYKMKKELTLFNANLNFTFTI